MSDHQAVVDYLVAKGEDSWRVGIVATEALRRIREFQNMKIQIRLKTGEVLEREWPHNSITSSHLGAIMRFYTLARNKGVTLKPILTGAQVPDLPRIDLL